MSSELFDRSASVIVSLAGKTTGIELSGLRIEFDVKKTSEKNPNTATVKVYNLSEDTRNQISTVETPQLILSAGYLDAAGEKVLFVGDITNILHEDQPPDRITTFECNDGEIALKNTRIAISRVEGSSAKDILNELVGAFKNEGIGLRYLDPTIADAQFANGFSGAGQASDLLDRIADRLGAEWSIQAKQLKLVKQGETDGLVAVKLSPTSGLVGTPKRLSYTALKKKEGLKASAGIARNAKKIGWSVEALLQPTIEPQGKVILESQEILNSGSTFRVETVSHTGDTHGSAWNTMIEVISL